jgi:hypothetical protein
VNTDKRIGVPPAAAQKYRYGQAHERFSRQSRARAGASPQPEDAAAALGISVPTFREHVRPELKAVYIAGATRYRVVDLEAWLAREAC